jgi:hypothetical protein
MAESLEVRSPATMTKVLLGALAVAATTAVSLARQGGAGALNTIYAEDGTIFLTQALHKSTLEALATPYAGYLHTVPRLITELVTMLPSSQYAAGLAAGGALVTSLMACLVYVASGQWFTGVLPRLLVAAVTVLVPVGQEELPNAIANLQWPALYALFWVLMWAPAAAGKRAVAVVTTLLISLSCVIALALFPLALWQAYRKRDRFSVLVLGAMSVGLAGQGLAMLSGTEQRPLNLDLVQWAPWWVIRAIPAGVIGQRWFGTEVDARWLVLAVLAWVILAVLVVLAWRRPGRPERLLAATAALSSLAVYAVPTILSGVATPRYGAAPAMLLIAALVALLIPRSDAGWRSPFAMLIVLCAVVWSTNLVVPNRRGLGPTWESELSQEQCVAGSKQIPITPAGQEWTVILPCDLAP